MRINKTLFLIIFGLILGYSSIRAQSADVISIKNELDNWMKGYNQKNLAKAVSVFDDHYVGLYAGYNDQSLSTIKDQYDKVFKNKFLKATLSMEIVDLETSGDLAYVSIKQKWGFKASIADKPQYAYEKGLLIMKKNKENKWKMIRSSTFAVKAGK